MFFFWSSEHIFEPYETKNEKNTHIEQKNMLLFYFLGYLERQYQILFVIPRPLKQLIKTWIEVSVLEVYNEKVSDVTNAMLWMLLFLQLVTGDWI